MQASSSASVVHPLAAVADHNPRMRRHSGHHLALITCPIDMPPTLWPQLFHLAIVPISLSHRHAGPHPSKQEARQESEEGAM
jgi:hypothetical protein